MHKHWKDLMDLADEIREENNTYSVTIVLGDPETEEWNEESFYSKVEADSYIERSTAYLNSNGFEDFRFVLEQIK